MDQNRVTDFSIERILSSQVGPKPQDPAETYRPVLWYQTDPRADPRCAVGQAAVGGPVRGRQKFRVRTVFTENQSKQLEALFQLTDYPSVEERAELAKKAALQEETVRVWFKNRRARRKRRMKSPPPPSSDPPAEKKLCACSQPDTAPPQ